MLTAYQKNKMSEALEKAVMLFQDDDEKQLEITQAQGLLKTCTDIDLTNVSDFVCGLHLISIADTGFDLNGAPYYTRFEDLPALYAIRPKTENGVITMQKLRNQFDVINQKG
ncbi:hypothetical protein [Sulfuricurvum sp.]|uniref:hypothetical protein n=1 Tax=Sulfuricurvum sp. TaxID=2025608 RepID=UPI00260AC0C8|nr:hypothetical protein [Sulfuricurvum sp.]MDD3596174.1 hypothetical protein [Sulfuricurvum sp.]